MCPQSDSGSNVIHTPLSPDGYTVGQTAADLTSMHGATPVAQRTSASQAAVITTTATNSSPYGYATQAQANALVTLVNEIRAALVEKGIIKGS